MGFLSVGWMVLNRTKVKYSDSYLASELSLEECRGLDYPPIYRFIKGSAATVFLCHGSSREFP